MTSLLIVAIQRHYNAVDAHASWHRCLFAEVHVQIGPFDVLFGPQDRSDWASSVFGHFGPQKRTEMTKDRSDQGPNWPYPEKYDHLLSDQNHVIGLEHTPVSHDPDDDYIISSLLLIYTPDCLSWSQYCIDCLPMLSQTV